LPDPNRIFIGGSGGNLEQILESCRVRLAADGTMVIALATLEHLNTAMTWVSQQATSQTWQHRLLQVQISRSVPVGKLTRFAPLNPVTLLTIARTQ
jgi:precorrin-6B C5,15-methyltransferase / cobalt-precorrin-6B C5,C15-methyltransferase